MQQAYSFNLWAGDDRAIAVRTYSLTSDVDASAMSFTLMRDNPQVAAIDVRRQDGRIVLRRERVAGKTVVLRLR